MSGSRHSFWSTGVWALLAAVVMLGWVAFGNAEEDRVAAGAPFRALHGVQSDAERAALTSLLEASYATLRSPEFAENLAALAGRYPAVYARDGRQDASPQDLADLVELKPWGARYVPADVALTGRADGYLGLTREGWAGEGRYSDIVLDRAVLAAWGAPDVVVRSCALNVAAHEYAHTLSTTPLLYRTAFTDTSEGQARIPGRRDRTTPVASYLIGSVAQCTWLQRQGRISRAEVAACVEVFGTASGNDQRCGQFANGEPVVPRPDLAPATPPL